MEYEDLSLNVFIIQVKTLGLALISTKQFTLSYNQKVREVVR